jgi:hypothetical protein
MITTSIIGVTAKREARIVSVSASIAQIRQSETIRINPSPVHPFMATFMVASHGRNEHKNSIK